MMNNNVVKWGVIIVAILVLVIGGFFWLQTSSHAKAAKLATFAQCITDSGAKFYGAFWCPHCQAQKALFETLFESAVEKLPYVECSTEDANSQLDVCKTESIQIYPTWKFADGSKNEGEITFQTLSEKTGCPLPQ